MKKPLSNQKNINTNDVKTNKDIEIPMNSKIDPKNVMIIYYTTNKHLFFYIK
jgi:hypothetical protein